MQAQAENRRLYVSSMAAGPIEEIEQRSVEPVCGFDVRDRCRGQRNQRGSCNSGLQKLCVLKRRRRILVAASLY
jgi:hypothetical protein